MLTSLAKSSANDATNITIGHIERQSISLKENRNQKQKNEEREQEKI
jgi:hypothetical protein